MKNIAKLLMLALAALLLGGCAGNNGGADANANAADVWVLFINAQKGDAALICAAGNYYIIDTGRKENAAELAALLKEYGAQTLEGAFLTHCHDDHTGGLKTLAEELTIKKAYRAEFAEENKKGKVKLDKKFEKYGLESAVLCAGDKIELGGGAYLRVLAPLELNEDDDNDNSLVFMLCANGHNVLFTGDMQFAEERTLLEAGADIKADVIKVGNHGNPDATSEEFAQAVGASAAVISTNTLHDTDSANARVIAALGDAQIFITQNDPVGIMLRLYSAAEGGLNIAYASK